MNFSNVLDSLTEYFLKAVDAFRHFGIVDFFDILLVAVVVFFIIKKLRKTQSIQIIIGAVLIGVIYGLVSLFGMDASRFLFNSVFADVIVIVAVIFAPELRRGLESIGKGGNQLKSLFTENSGKSSEEVVSNITNAAKIMAGNKVGSLIIIQRSSLLGDLTGGGVIIDSLVSEELLGNIFYPKSPLHDGAVVIKDDRIVAARCVVPLRDKATISSRYGTRHRAAIEVSHYSDAIVVVTSEERGQISYAKDGHLEQNITPVQLYGFLSADLGLVSGPEKKKHSFADTEKTKTKKVKTKQTKVAVENTAEKSEKLTIDDIVLPGEEEAAAEPEIKPDVKVAEIRDTLTIINEGEANDEQE